MAGKVLGRYLRLTGWFLVLATWAPLLRVHNRWIRMLEFPSLQLAFWCLVNLGLTGLGAGRQSPRIGWAFLFVVSFLRHAAKLFPFTRLKSVETESAPDDAAPSDAVSLLISNVLMSNRNSAGLLDLVERENPDLVLLIEPDRWWAEQTSGLEETYPWHVKVPQSNTYGMILYSRLPLRETRVDRRLHEEVPSLQALVEMPSGKTFRLFGVHPRPPAEEHTTVRDAELYLIGSETSRSGLPCLVAGDLNDVAWSRTTRLFQKVSGTLDPRVGRGFYNTFHAKLPLLRYSLDHVFHTREFRLVDLRRLEGFGSDHFPIFIRLHLNPWSPGGKPPAPPDSGEREKVEETVRDARDAP